VGGAGLSHLEFALVERELGRGCMALNHFFGPRGVSSTPVATKTITKSA
jgi:acyl-CoA dehydrogenase